MMTTSSQSKQSLGKIKSMLTQGNEKPKKSGKMKMVLIPVIILLGLGVVYFFIYSNKQGKKFDERRFRVLTMLEENIAKKEAGYKEVINSLKQEAQRRILLAESSATSPDEIQSTTVSDMREFINEINTREGKIFENLLISDVENEVEEFGYYLTDYLSMRPYKLIDGDNVAIIQNQIKNLERVKRTNNSSGIIAGIFDAQIGQQIKTLKKELKQEISNYKEVTIGVFIKLSDYIEDLIPGNTFDHLMILEKTDDQLKIKFQNLPNKVISTGEKALDSLLTSSAGMLSGNIKYLEAGGERYRVYVHLSQPNANSFNSEFSSDLQINSIVKGQEIICGLVREGKYLASKRKVDIWYIIVLAICMVITIVSLPLLKVYLINDIEGLGSSDVVLTGVSVIVGAPLLLLIILAVRDYELYSQNNHSQKLETLGHNLDANLRVEILEILEQLNDVHNDSVFAEWVNSKRNTVSTTSLSEEDIQRFRHYKNFNEFFDLTPTGSQTFSFTTYDDSLALLNLSERGYFQNLQNGNFWKIRTENEIAKTKTDDTDKLIQDIHIMADQEYVLESISSWTTGSHEVVVGIKNPRADGLSKFLALSSRLASLMNPILEPGYGFAVIDETGQTWFHSNPSRINNENFLEEIGENPNVQSAIYGRIPTNTKATYWGQSMRIHIRPSSDFPLYFVTFYKIENARSLTAEIATMCLLFIVGGFLLVGVVVISTAYMEPNKGFFKFKRFVFEWMRPKDNKREAIGISTHMMWYLFLGFIGICVWTYSQPISWADSQPISLADIAPNIVATGLLLPALCYISNYWLIQKHWRFQKAESTDSSGPFSIKKVRWVLSFFGLLLGSLIIKHVIFGAKSDTWDFIEFIIFGSFVVGFMVVLLRLEQSKHTEYAKLLIHAMTLQVMLLAMAKYIHYPIFLFFVLYWFLVTILFYISGEGIGLFLSKISFWPARQINKKTALSSKQYLKFLMTWLTVSSLVPTFVVFALSKDLEELLTKRYDQLSIAKQFEQKIESTPSEFKSTISPLIESKTFGNIPKDEKTVVNRNFEDYLGDHKVEVIDRDAYEDEFLKMQIDTALSFSVAERLIFNLRPIYSKSLSEKRVALADFSSDHRWHWKTHDQKSLFHYLLSKSDSENQVALKITTKNTKTNSANFFHTMFLDSPINVVSIIGAVLLLLVLLGAIIEYLALNIFSWKFRNYEKQSVTSVEELKETVKSNEKCLLIFNSRHAKNAVKKEMNFPEGIDLDQVAIQPDGQKQDFLRDMLSKDEKVLLLTSYPTELLESIQDDPDGAVVSRLISEYVSEYEQVIISERLYENLAGIPGDLGDPEGLWNLENKEAFNDDMQVFKKQQGSYTYFQDLWNSASNREKYILYDLADDGIANTKNITSVLYLMDKGLIRWEGKLCLFSKGFRAFILGSIRRSKGKNIEDEMSSRGAWSTIKFILYGIIAAVFIFIAIGEPDFFNDFNTLLTVIASVVTLFPIIGGIFSTGVE